MFNEEFGGQGQLKALRQGGMLCWGGWDPAGLGGWLRGVLAFNRKRNELGVWGEPCISFPSPEPLGDAPGLNRVEISQGLAVGDAHGCVRDALPKRTRCWGLGSSAHPTTRACPSGRGFWGGIPWSSLTRGCCSHQSPPQATPAGPSPAAQTRRSLIPTPSPNHPP